MGSPLIFPIAEDPLPVSDAATRVKQLLSEAEKRRSQTSTRVESMKMVT